MNRAKYIILIIVTTLIMGTSFPVGKIGLSYAPPFLLMGLRYITCWWFDGPGPA
ncbi:hypothetical protein [Paenibacillus xylanexedens]|uniref:hypothetical protein n=1 Tax=Paenibacillus xylanexedens TaxID=528191 RepID=UPI0028D36F86|nr:hypothetical protein [Paenibacillus xylanexedens]